MGVFKACPCLQVKACSQAPTRPHLSSSLTIPSASPPRITHRMLLSTESSMILQQAHAYSSLPARPASLTWYATFQEGNCQYRCRLFTHYLCHSLRLCPNATLEQHWHNIVDWTEANLGNLLLVDARGHHQSPFLPEVHKGRPFF